MSNQWLNNLRRKMENHTEDVPDGLWDDIRDELFRDDEKDGIISFPLNDDNKKEKKVKTSGTNIKPLLYRIAGIAAAITILFIIGGQLFENYEGEGSTNKILYSKKNSTKGAIEHASDGQVHSLGSGQNIGVNPFSEIQGNVKNITSNKMSTENSFIDILNQKINGLIKIDDHTNLEILKINTIQDLFDQEKTLSQDEGNIADTNQSVNEKESTGALLSKHEKEQQNKSEKSKLAKHQSDKPWMLSLLTGNTSAGSSMQFPGYATMNGSPMGIIEGEFGAAGYEDTPLNQILLANQDEEIKATIRHKVPVTLGISLYHNLGKKWGIGTGVNYTKLSSELHSGSQSNYIKSEQSVHYVGIPVQVNYNAVQKGKFTGYVTAGALVEKAVAGNLTTKYIVNDEVKEEKKESLEAKPVQFSVNGALGVQYKIIKNVGIYAEPGIGYHFKDNSSLNTIYKEKPLNFNMKFGVRLLID